MTLENQDPIGGEDQATQQATKPPANFAQTPAELDPPPPESKCKHSCKEKKHWLEFVTFGLELLGLVVLCVYAAYTIKIYCANKDAAEAARDAVTLARDNIHLDQRAWVAVDNVIPPVIKEKKPLTLVVDFKNTGKTPAQKVVAYVKGEFVPKGKGPQLAAEKLPGQSVIPPNGVYHTTLGDYAKPQVKIDVDVLSSGTKVIWVHGKLTYDDIFGGSHWSTFCYYFIPQEKTRQFGAGGFASCESGNDVGDGDGPPA